MTSGHKGRLLRRGDNSLPLGYTRLAYIENGAAQWTYTDLTFGTGVIKMVTSASQCANPTYTINTYNNISSSSEYGQSFGLDHRAPNYVIIALKGISSSQFFFQQGNIATVELNAEEGYVVFNGVRRKAAPQTWEGPPIRLGIFTRATAQSYTWTQYQRSNPGSQIHELDIVAKYNGETKHSHFIPAMNSDGNTGFYDVVSGAFKTNLDKDNPASFIAGVNNLTQLYAVLAKLPDKTGQEQGALTIRLDAALQTDELRALIDARAEAKNWEITEAA